MEQESDATAGIVSADPLVTLSVRNAQTPMGIAGAKPEAYHGRKALHLIALSETIEEDGRQTKIARDVQAISAELPDSRFVIMPNTEFEAYLLSPLKLSSFPCSRLIFANDAIFKPMEETAAFDAVAETRNEALLADPARIMWPSSHGEARAREINRARVGLCLTAADVQAAMEYLLCGLPVVATPPAIKAGRYFMPPFCRAVPEAPHAIAAAIEGFAGAHIPKAAVRGYIMHLLRFERHNFLIAANKLAKETFGVDGVFSSFEPFTRAWRPS